MRKNREPEWTPERRRLISYLPEITEVWILCAEGPHPLHPLYTLRRISASGRANLIAPFLFRFVKSDVRAFQ